MKISAILFLTMLLVHPLIAQVPMKHFYSPLLGINHSFFLVSGDEFNDPVLDLKKWRTTHEYGNGFPIYEYYNPYPGYNFSHDQDPNNPNNKFLTLLSMPGPVWGFKLNYCENEPTTPSSIYTCIQNDGGANYRIYPITSAMIETIDKYRWVHSEIRWKGASGPGHWPAYWYYGGGHEIDVFENIGDCPTKTHWDVHYPGEPPGIGGWESPLNSGDDFGSNFHVFEHWWYPGYQWWFVYNNSGSGKNYGSLPSPEATSLTEPMNIMASMQVASPCPSGTAPCVSGFCTDLNSAQWPGNFIIDYIRIWAKFSCPADKSPTNLCSWQRPLTKETVIMTGLILNVDGGPGCNTIINSGRTEFWGNSLVSLKIGFSASAGTDYNYKFKAAVVGANPNDIRCDGIYYTDYAGDFQVVEQTNNTTLDPASLEHMNEFVQQTTNSTPSYYTNRYFSEVPKDDEGANLLEVIISPNPSNGRLTLDLGGSMSYPVRLRVMDAKGSILAERDLMNERNSMDFSNLNNGIYLFQFTNNQQIASKRVVISK